MPSPSSSASPASMGAGSAPGPQPPPATATSSSSSSAVATGQPSHSMIFNLANLTQAEQHQLQLQQQHHHHLLLQQQQAFNAAAQLQAMSTSSSMPSTLLLGATGGPAGAASLNSDSGLANYGLQPPLGASNLSNKSPAHSSASHSALASAAALQSLNQSHLQQQQQQRANHHQQQQQQQLAQLHLQQQQLQSSLNHQKLLSSCVSNYNGITSNLNLSNATAANTTTSSSSSLTSALPPLSNTTMPKLGVTSTTSSDHQNHNHLAPLNNNNNNTNQQAIDSNLDYIAKLQQQQQKLFPNFSSMHPLSWQQQTQPQNQNQQQQRLQQDQATTNSKWPNSSIPYTNANLATYPTFRPNSTSSGIHTNNTPSSVTNANMNNNNNNTNSFNNHSNNNNCMIGQNGDNPFANNNGIPLKLRFDGRNPATNHLPMIDSNMSLQSIDPKSMNLPSTIKPNFQLQDNVKTSPQSLIDSYKMQTQRINEELERNSERLSLFTYNLLSNCIPGTNKPKKIVPSNSIEDLRQSIYVGEFYLKFEELATGILTNQIIIPDFSIIDYIRRDKLSIQELTKMETIHQRLGLSNILSLFDLTQKLYLQKNAEIKTSSHQDISFNNNLDVAMNSLQQQTSFNQLQAPKTSPFIPPMPAKSEANSIIGNRRSSNSPSDNPTRSQSTNGYNPRSITGPSSSHQATHAPFPINQTFQQSSLPMPVNPPPRSNGRHLFNRGPPLAPAMNPPSHPPRSASAFGVVPQQKSPGTDREPPAAHQSSSVRPNMIASTINMSTNQTSVIPVSAHLSSTAPQTPKIPLHDTYITSPIKPSQETTNNPSPFRSTGPILNQSQVMMDPKMPNDSSNSLPSSNLLGIRQPDSISKTDTLIKRGDVFINPGSNYLEQNVSPMQKSNSYISPNSIDSKLGLNNQIQFNNTQLPPNFGNPSPIRTHFLANNLMSQDSSRKDLKSHMELIPTPRRDCSNNNPIKNDEQIEQYNSLMKSIENHQSNQASQSHPLLQVPPVQNQLHLPPQQVVDFQHQVNNLPPNHQQSLLQSQTPVLSHQHQTLSHPPLKQTTLQTPMQVQPPQTKTIPHVSHVLQEHNQPVSKGAQENEAKGATDNQQHVQIEQQPKLEGQQTLKSPDLLAQQQQLANASSFEEKKQHHLTETTNVISSKSETDCNTTSLNAGVTIAKINVPETSKPNSYPRLKKAWLINYDQEEDKASKLQQSANESSEMAVKKCEKKAPLDEVVADGKASSKSCRDKSVKKIKSEANKKAKVVSNSTKRKTTQVQQAQQQTPARNSRANKVSYNESEMSVVSTSELDSDDTGSSRPKHKRLRRMPKRKVKPSSDKDKEIKEKDLDKKQDTSDQPSCKPTKVSPITNHSSGDSKKSTKKAREEDINDEDVFLQIEPCYEIVQKSIRCLECRRVRVPNPKSDKAPIAKQTTKTNWDDFCRFYEFRKLKTNTSGNIVTAGFSNLHDAKEEDTLLCLPDLNYVPEDFTYEIASYILSNVGDEFDKIVMQERAALELYKQEHKEDTRTNWKRTVSGLRELCDVCSTTLFNRHFVCESCGFVVCIDCYRERSSNVSKSTRKDVIKSENEMSVDEATSTDAKDSTTEATDQPQTPSNSKKNKKDQFGWIYCTKNELHSHEKLVLTQIIAGDCLEELWTMLRNYRLSQQVTDVIEECLSLLPCDPKMKKNCSEVNNNVLDQETHSWLIDGDLLVLNHARHEKNMELFRQQWRQAKPVLVRGVDKLMKIKMWLPQFFGKEFGDYRSDLVDCRNGDIHRHSMKKYWDNFEPNGNNIKKKVKDEALQPPVSSANNEELSNGPSYYSGSALWRLKDWPPGQDFNEILPAHYEDFMNNLPLEEYTTRCGKLNLALRLPKEMLKPDLGPKMYSAYGTTKFPDRGTTNIHLDISDAINVMVYVSGATAFNNGSEEARDIFDKTIDDCPVDERMKQHIKDNKLIPGALWHIFKPSDTQKMREFLNKVADERNITAEKRNDPIHDQTWYLDQVLLDRLYREYEVKSYAILQCMGDAILIPAGAPHQVKNLQNCIKVANDFVSPENVGSCLQLTDEFRSLPETHINQEDKLQIKNILYHSVKESLQYLNCKKL